MARAEELLELTSPLAARLVELFPGTTISGVTVCALLEDESFAYPLVSGPSDEHLAGFAPFGRRVMARTLRDLADRWDPDHG